MEALGPSVEKWSAEVQPIFFFREMCHAIDALDQSQTMKSMAARFQRMTNSLRACRSSTTRTRSSLHSEFHLDLFHVILLWKVRINNTYPIGFPGKSIPFPDSNKYSGMPTNSRHDLFTSTKKHRYKHTSICSVQDPLAPSYAWTTRLTATNQLCLPVR